MPPVVDSNTITVDEESTSNPLGLNAPTDADNNTLTITVTGLPTLGVVKKANGDIVLNNSPLTITELTGLIYDAPTAYNVQIILEILLTQFQTEQLHQLQVLQILL